MGWGERLARVVNLAPAGGCVPLKALYLVSIISNPEINIYF